MTKKILQTTLALALAGAATQSSAAIVMLDFGSDGAYTGTDSPGHADGAIATSYTTWSEVGGGDTTVTDSESNSLTYKTARSDSEGESDAGGFNFVRNGATSNPGGGTGIWGTSLTGSYLADITSANRRDPVAITLEGFAPGDYDIFVVAQSSGNTSIPLNVSVGLYTNTPSGDVGFGSLSEGSTTLAGGGTTWIEGTNYAKYTVTLAGAVDTIMVAVENTSNTGTGVDFRGSISSLQIVAVPEPSTYALMAGFLALGLVMIRRRLS